MNELMFTPSPVKLGFYRLAPDVTVPTFGTPGAACFDLRAFFGTPAFQKMTAYGKSNAQSELFAHRMVDCPEPNCYGITLYPYWRVLIPTGLVMDIPHGFSVRIHARSGAALKQGLVLANGEGVIDSDYRHQSYIMMTNISGKPVNIMHGDRIAQGELVKNVDCQIEALRVCTSENDVPKVEGRSGGFGSTGMV